MLLALYVAFTLQLQSPSSAAVTVLIVANPVNGALVSKSIWRLAGTFAGAAAAVLLMASFAQAPLLFFLAFSLCIGIACLISTLLRFFKAYGAVLAGYTIILVCAPAFANPDDVFSSALSRLSAVSVGIASAALIFLLTAVRPPTRLTQASLDLIRATAATLAGQITSTACTERLHERRSALLAQASQLQEIIEYAIADSYRAARRATALRLGAAGLTGTLTVLHAHHPRLHSSNPHASALNAALSEIQQLDLADAPASLTRLSALFHSLSAPFHVAEVSEDASEPSALEQFGAQMRTADLVERLHDSIADLLAHPTAISPNHANVRLRLFLDWPTAFKNAARGFLVTILACMTWYVTQWPAATTLLAYLVPASCLLATNPSASRASIDFAIGTLLAIPASYVCEALLLPRIAGFPLLAGSLVLCLLPGIWLQFNQRYGLRAFGYVVFFSAMVSVRNPVQFDDPALINNWLAYIVGCASLVVVFRALLPANPTRDVARLHHSILAATQQLATVRTIPPLAAWEFLQMQRAARMAQRMQQPQNAAPRYTMDDAFGAIELGRDLHRLRGLLSQANSPIPAKTDRRALLSALARLTNAPEQASCAAFDQSRQLARSRAPHAPLASTLLHQIGTAIDTHAQTPEPMLAHVE